jgi:hypothetical protein
MTLHLSKRTSWIIAVSFCTALFAVAVPMSLSNAEAAAKASPDEFSIVGTWTGHNEQVNSATGYRNGTATLTVTDASGLTFTGTMGFSTSEGDFSDPLAGAFSPGGALIAAGDEEGVYSFALINAKTLDYCYVESGDRYLTSCARLKKQQKRTG